MAPLIIKTSRLTRMYGSITGVSNLEIEIAEGESFGLIGPNGAGKTTTIRLLLGFIKPTSGFATVLGRNPGEPEILERIGYCPGEPAIYEHTTADRFFQLVGRIRGDRYYASAAAWAKRFDLPLHRRILKLSRGNRQKVQLICAIAHDPELLILDEPFSGCDPPTRQMFMECIEQLIRGGSGVFIASHQLHDITRICTRVGFIDNGKLIEDQHINELRRRMPHRIRISVPPEYTLHRQPGIESCKKIAPGEYVIVTHAIGTLLKYLADLPVISLDITSGGLEHLFLSNAK